MLKQVGYRTFFTGKWHLGESDYALPIAHGYDEMKAEGLYHLNAYTYADPAWFPDMPDTLRAMFAKVTKGLLDGTAGQPVREVAKINGQYINTPAQGVVGIPFLDEYIEEAATEYLDKAATAGAPFFMSINFMKVHQPNLPHPDFINKSPSKSKYADSIVENDTRIGRIMDKVRALGLDKNTYVFWTSDNGAWQDVYPDAGYTPFRGTKGTVREGGNRVPSFAWGPGIKAGSRNYDIVGGLDYMATFAALAGVKLLDKDRAGQPIIFDSYDMSPLLFGKGTWAGRRGSTSPKTSSPRAPFAITTTSSSSTCAAMTARRPVASPWTATWAGRERPSTWPRCPRCSTSGKTPKSATISS